MLTEMNGEPWNPTAHHHDRLPQARGVYVTLERQIMHGGTKGCAACFGHAKGALAGMQGTIPGHCGRRSYTDSSCERK